MKGESVEMACDWGEKKRGGIVVLLDVGGELGGT